MNKKPSKVGCSRQSLFGLNAVNFFTAELASVIGPFIAVYLQGKHWSFEEIGIATSAGGLGVLLFQTPAGYLCDVVTNRKQLLILVSLAIGLCLGALPLVANHVLLVDLLLVFTGGASSFLVPLLATIAMCLVPPKRYAFVTGQNQSWNHAGNIVAAVAALVIVKTLGVEPIFYMMAGVSLLTIATVQIIRSEEMHEPAGTTADLTKRQLRKHLKRFFKDREILCLLAAVLLFSLTNSPGLPLVGLYVKTLGGDDSFVAWAVLVAQATMIPIAFFAGSYCDTIGRKTVFSAAFLVLPVRLLLYTFLKNQNALLAVQILDGVSAGIYGVAIPLICRDHTAGKGGFNLLVGIAQTAMAIGGFIGLLLQGFAVTKFGFPITFGGLGVIAILGAVVFMLGVHETKIAD